MPRSAASRKNRAPPPRIAPCPARRTPPLASAPKPIALAPRRKQLLPERKRNVNRPWPAPNNPQPRAATSRKPPPPRKRNAPSPISLRKFEPPSARKAPPPLARNASGDLFVAAPGGADKFSRSNTLPPLLPPFPIWPQVLPPLHSLRERIFADVCHTLF